MRRRVCEASHPKQDDGYVYVDSMEEILEKVGSSSTHTVNAPFTIDKPRKNKDDD